ncbi:hypothetical protein [uncultured Legionella sp.]|uniref:hypothetical protein n=1 Tax=uncultured Legionella sp. TaxID=210934 RepID=UPI00261CA49E|nr:hypothetical protein [uncultured Legionella sp.]
MKLLTEMITSEIEQITNPALKNWLLDHLNRDADNVRELFCKQIPNQLIQTALALPATLTFPRHLAIFPVVYVFAPDVLREQLMSQLSLFPQLVDETGESDKNGCSNFLRHGINEIKEAWPIIAALRSQGANELIKVLEQADECSLSALERLNSDPNIEALLPLFRIKKTKELDEINRHLIIPFLRQPDFNGWFHRYLDLFTDKATELMSLRLLFLTFSAETDELDKLTELRTCIDAYPFSIKLEALWAVCHYYQLTLEQDLFSSASAAYVMLLHEVLQKMNLERQIEFLKGINQAHYLLIIDFCLKQCTEGSSEEQQIYFELLLLMCAETVVPNKECLQAIKSRLLQQDAYLFETPQIHQLSLNILTELSENGVVDFSGYWIERLISSPRFVAGSSSQTLHHLIARYHLHCITLEPVALDSLISSSTKDNSESDWQIHLRRVNLQIINRSEGRSTWLAKRHQLLRTGIECHANRVLVQMEARCTQKNNPDFKFGKQALQVLYAYFNHVYADLRFDLLVRAIDSGYQEQLDSNEDLASIQEVLYGLKSFVLKPETENELQHNRLYNSAGQSIGFVNEANKAITYVEDEPVLFSCADAHEEPVYDSSCQVIGYLTGTGQIKSAASAHKTLGARLLTMISEKVLDRSSSALDLIIRHVLFENSLDVLFESEQVIASTAKQQWLERRISGTIQHVNKELEPAFFKSLTRYFSAEGAFSLLASMGQKDNALCLFHEIIHHDQKREQWLGGLYAADVHQFWVRHQAVSCFAEYLVTYYDKPWFAKGLSQFACFGKKYKVDDLLSSALAALSHDSRQCVSGTARFDAVLTCLIGTETNAALVLKDFLNDRDTMAVQHVKIPEIDKVARYFHKVHLLAAIHQLNHVSYWEGKAQYKLLLHFLDRQYASVFVVKESRLTAKEEWSRTELNELSHFINRHLGKKRSLDKEWSIGHRILGELIFRSANEGLTSLFYTKKIFNESLARLSFTRSYLERMIDKFWLPDRIKEQIHAAVPRLKIRLQNTTPLSNELSENQILHDWRVLVHQTWNEINKKKLPLICAYLLNYSGQKQPLQRLLNDYLSSFRHKTEYLYPLTRLLQQFPLRDVSFVLFDVLETAIIKNPFLFDRTVLRDMAQFYVKNILHEDMSSPDAELKLLIYFGHNKYYDVVREGCKALAETCVDKTLKRRLNRGINEAEVEGSLYVSPRQFFFEFIKTLKRLWHYGLFAEGNASQIVKFCDDESPGPARTHAADEVHLPAAKVRIEHESLSADIKKKQLIRLLDAIKRSPGMNAFEGHPSKVKQTLFGSTSSQVNEQVVASKQDVITI